MSCGLGAIVLVFLLVKYNVEIAVPQNDLLEKDLVQLEKQESRLREEITNIHASTRQIIIKIKSTSNNLSQIRKKGVGKTEDVFKLQQQLFSLKEKIKNFKVAKTEDFIEAQNIGEENYVIGLNIEGRKVGILIDASSSMTDEILVDVIRRKNTGDSSKKTGPKWQRTKKIVKWILARLPINSTVNVIAFNNQAVQLGSSDWVSSQDQNALNSIYNDMEGLVPEGPTNLEVGLKALAKSSPSNVYLITDGLPTKGTSNYKSLNPFSSCSSLQGQSNTISGSCREKLFQHTVRTSAPPRNVPINVILLPIEGDPTASNAYWSWTAATGGVLISPARSWP